MGCMKDAPVNLTLKKLLDEVMYKFFTDHMTMYTSVANEIYIESRKVW